MNSASYEYRKMLARRGAQFVHIEMPNVCRRTFPANTTKILSTRNSSILMMSSSEYLFLESECSFTKYVSSCPKTKYLYLRLSFLKMKAFLIILVSLFFNFWWDKKQKTWCLLHCWKFEIYNVSGWCLAYVRLFQTQTLTVTISTTVLNKQDKRVLVRCGMQMSMLTGEKKDDSSASFDVRPDLFVW